MHELVLLGLNHKTAPIDLREQLAFQESEMETALARLRSLPSLKEGMILSTCNRVELYGVSGETERTIRDLKAFLSDFHGIPLNRFEQNLYHQLGEEAVRHLFRVASSLDSMVVGEPQILGQLKSAYAMAAESKASGLILHRLLHRAFYVAKRVRTETRIGNSAVSVSSVAVELAQRIFESLKQRTVLLLGAGEMAELAARHLLAQGVGKILVVNRTFERALALASEFQAEALPFDQLEEGLKRADIVISATDSPHYLLLQSQISKLMRIRKQRPIFFIDIADPRDVEPAVGELENVYLYNIDDLQKVAYENMKDRQQEAQKAEAIVQEEVGKFVRWYQSLDLTPTIVALREKCEEIRKREVAKMLALHPQLSEKERQSLEAMTLAIVNKILHGPISRLKGKDEEGMSNLYVDALRTLFQLPEAPQRERKERTFDPDGPS
ncbi:MAG: glutamyl-tRNA reductase [Desulfobacterota bacterium]|nr:glutamyl-tRNA reductase [Thermodesulfobacteriota bacterium]